MKRKFKILFTAAIFTAVLIFTRVPVFASENSVDYDTIVSEENVNTEQIPNEENQDALPLPNSESTAETVENSIKNSSDAEEKNTFQLIYETLVGYATEIFSFLSLVGTLIISYFYRRGLLPSVKTAMAGLGSAVGKIKESSERQCESQRQDAENAAQRFNELENLLAAYGEKLTVLEEHLISEEEMQRQRERSDRILSAQIDMLYDIFMTSSIPHYQKEATGERIGKMRKEIEGYEKA